MAEKAARDGVISNMRACLLSVKGAVNIRTLNGDYRMLVGENIPYRKLGYPSLEDFLADIPGIRIAKRGAEWVIDAQPTEDTYHITRMVSRQKSASKKHSRRTAVNHRRPTPSSWKPASMSEAYHRNVRVNAGNQYYQNQRNNTVDSNPMVQLQQKKPTVTIYQKPTVNIYPKPTVTIYQKPKLPMLPNIETSQHSPTKKQQDRSIPPLMIPPLIPRTNQSTSQMNSDGRMKSIEQPLKSVTPKKLPQGVPTINHTPPPPLITPSSSGRVGTSSYGPVLDQPKIPTKISDRLIVKMPTPKPSVQKPLTLSEGDFLPLSPPQTPTSPLPPTIDEKTLSSSLQGKKPCAQLIHLARALNLPEPVYKLVPRTPIGESVVYSCQVKVGAASYTSYPDERPTSQEAEELAAAGLVKRLLEEHLSGLSETTNQQLIKERVTRIVNEHQNESGMNMHGVPILYKQQFKENLPEDWLRVIKDCSDITMTTMTYCGGGDFIILHAKRTGAAGYTSSLDGKATTRKTDEHQFGSSETTDHNLIRERVTSIVNEKQSGSGLVMHEVPILYKQQFKDNLPADWLNVMKECSDISMITSHRGGGDSIILRTEKIAYLTPPADQYWDIFITCVMNTMDIWARFIGEDFSVKYESMENDMKDHYARTATNSLGPTKVEVGSYYAILQFDGWYRVQCLEYDETSGETLVLFIDFGDEELFPCSRLVTLDRKFFRLPAQAMRLCLAGLEDFDGCDTVVEQLQEILLEHTVVAEVLTRGSDDDGPFATVMLYDTYGPEDTNLNEMIFEKIIQHLTPKLKDQGHITEVFMSHILENGDLYVQVSTSMRHLTQLLAKLIHTGLSAERVAESKITSVEFDKIYLARSDGGVTWDRAVLSKVYSKNKFEMFLVDSGTTTIVGKDNLLSLNKLSEALSKYPHQALKVRLHNIPDTMYGPTLMAELAELVPQSEPLLVKVVTLSIEGLPPTIEMFKRQQPNNMLGSINATVADRELTRLMGDGNNNTRPRKRVERSISKHGLISEADPTLRSPKIPEIGEFFDVHVTMAANPGNFTVQPYLEAKSLNEMMNRLQEVCMSYQGPIPTPGSIKKSSLYAAKHNDKRWYRVSVSNIINDEMVTVYFCDYGDASVLQVDRLQPLGREFLKLRYQAIRARLVGIQPMNTDWSVEDCMRFQELVMERDFVSKVEESCPDEMSPAATILGLELIDVSKENDVCIGELLVEEGRAKKKEA